MSPTVVSSPIGHVIACRSIGAEIAKLVLQYWHVSRETVAEARRDPEQVRRREAPAPLDLIPPSTPYVGDSATRNVRCIVRTHEGQRWLTIDPQEDGGPIRITAAFFDHDGSRSLTIQGNEWIVSTGQWDTVVDGTRITVRRTPVDIASERIAMPPNALKLNRLAMMSGALEILIEPSGEVAIHRGQGVTCMRGCGIVGADALFEI